MSLGTGLQSLLSGANSTLTSAGTAQALQNIIQAMGPWWATLEYFIFFAGLFMVGAALMSVYKSGGRGAPATKTAIAGFVVGVLFTSIPAWMATLSETVFQESGPTALTLTPTGTGEYGYVITFGFDVLMLVGLYATAKALLLFRDSAEDRSKTGPAIGHLVGGVAALNMKVALTSLALTVGGLFQQAVMKIIGG